MFVAEYLIDLNGRKAAIRAGFAEKSAHVTASRLLKDPWVKAEVRRELGERRQRLKVDAERVEEELAKIGFANLLDYVEPDGSINLRKINRDLAAAIQEVKIDKIEMAGPGPMEKTDRSEEKPAKASVITTRLKLHPKVPALELLGKRLKMFTDRVEHGGKISVVVDL